LPKAKRFLTRESGRLELSGKNAAVSGGRKCVVGGYEHGAGDHKSGLNGIMLADRSLLPRLSGGFRSLLIADAIAMSPLRSHQESLDSLLHMKF